MEVMAVTVRRILIIKKRTPALKKKLLLQQQLGLSPRISFGTN
jgi:hypothetical protein